MKKRLCLNCGAELGERDFHLCMNASFLESQKCRFCGKPTSDPRHICKFMVPHLRYKCANCGRIAVGEEVLCNPNAIK